MQPLLADRSLQISFELIDVRLVDDLDSAGRSPVFDDQSEVLVVVSSDTASVEINLGLRILLGSSFYEDWSNQEMFVTKDGRVLVNELVIPESVANIGWRAFAD